MVFFMNWISAQYLGHDQGNNCDQASFRTVECSSVPYHVAETREPIKLSRGIPDSRFPDWIPNQVLIEHMDHCNAVHL